jgi:hypothetical protein
MIKYFLPVLLIAGLIVGVISSRPKAKQSAFSLKMIAPKYPYHPEWETRILNDVEWEEVDRALSQPYRYLASGGQTFNFVSRDERYVIKFFKQKKFAIPEWIESFPLPSLMSWLKDKKEMKQHKKRDKVFTAFKLCFEKFPQETGLLFVHLNQTDALNKVLSFSDASGKEHALNLDHVEFVLQRKAELADYRLDSLMANGQFDETKKAIDALLALQFKFCEMGLRNRDPNFRANFGFIGEKAVLIDVGRVVYFKGVKNSDYFSKALTRNIERFRKYLKIRHPELIPYFNHSLKEHTEKFLCSDPLLNS